MGLGYLFDYKYGMFLREIFANDFAQTVKAMVPHDSQASAGYGYTLDGDGYEITDEQVYEMRDKIAEKLKHRPLIYRYVFLRPNDLAAYLLSPLGTFWCHDWEINLDSLTGWDTAPRDAELYRLSARVDLSNVDMARTVIQNLAVPWENEITVIAGSPLDLIRVDLLPDVDLHARAVSQPFGARSHIA